MRTAFPLALALALAGCGKTEPDSTGPTTEPIDCSTVTDTVPAFCGQVPTNLLFLSIDTFRKDRLARYGGDPYLTPNLDRLAAEGVVLDDNIQCSNWTYASTTCTLAGQSNLGAGFLPRLAGAAPIPEGRRFLPGYLRDAGYWSVLVSSNAWLSGTWGNGRDYSAIVFPGGGRITGVADNGINALRGAQDFGLADKWMLHLHGLEPHAPYVPGDEYLGGLADLEPTPFDLTSQESHYAAASQWPNMTQETRDLLEAHLRVRYDGEIKLLDDGIGAMMDRLEREGLLDDTLVVIWTDHGEQFWEHGKHTHAHALYGEENDTLAIYWAKNIVPEVRTEPTHSIDITPTVLGLLGLPIPAELDGMPLGTAPMDRARFAAVDARDGIVQSVVKDGWKLQFNWFGDLYLTHPAFDPAETPLDLVENAAKVDELWLLLEPKVYELIALKGFDPDWPSGREPAATPP